jgi:hypothetical protein
MGDVLSFPGTPAVPSGDQLVCVPGQRFWHTHTCRKCGSSWTHIAPRPMTQAMNEQIHTCTKCGELVYAFVKVGPADSIPWAGWLAGGVVLGLLGAALLDRG